eukprot:TRINITY_DN23246_c0_g1_i1.p1 TRINITY_DN23246_c0_g1~~TRINITY_DN23246_c0_g1_i1.p1  ORF type:complete len:759 (+),score=81.37 TRINITY_DN23246_c0_g1_i1:40-2316(+)
MRKAKPLRSKKGDDEAKRTKPPVDALSGDIRSIATVFATELAAPFSAPACAYTNFTNALQKRSGFRNGRAVVMDPAPRVTEPPFRPLTPAPSIGAQPTVSFSLPPSRANTPQPSAPSWRPRKLERPLSRAASANGAFANDSVLPRSASALGTSSTLALPQALGTLKSRLSKTLPNGEMANDALTAELEAYLDLLAHCLRQREWHAKPSDSPLATLSALKLLGFVDRVLNSNEIDQLSDSSLYGILLGLRDSSGIGVSYAAAALTLLADLVERSFRATVMMYYILQEEGSEFLVETHLFLLLCYLTGGPLRDRLLAFCVTLVQRGVLSHDYLVYCVEETQRRLDTDNPNALPRAALDEISETTRPFALEPGPLMAILQHHWIAHVNVELRAFVTPQKRVVHTPEGSLQTAVLECEGSYFECPELSYPPFLFSPDYPVPPTSTLIQGQVVHESGATAQFQYFRVEIELLCTHDAVDESEESLVLVYAHHYDVPKGSPAEGTSKDPRLHILRARHDVRCLLDGQGNQARGAKPITPIEQYDAACLSFDSPLMRTTDDNGAPTIFLSDAGPQFRFRFRFRRKVVIPFFLSDTHRAFLFTVQINHSYRYCDVFDDLCDSHDPNLYADPNDPEKTRFATATSASTSKDRRLDKLFRAKKEQQQQRQQNIREGRLQPTRMARLRQQREEEKAREQAHSPTRERESVSAGPFEGAGHDEPLALCVSKLFVRRATRGYVEDEDHGIGIPSTRPPTNYFEMEYETYTE